MMTTSRQWERLRQRLHHIEMTGRVGRKVSDELRLAHLIEYDGRFDTAVGFYRPWRLTRRGREIYHGGRP